jgi:aspartate beta-hydroxylase
VVFFEGGQWFRQAAARFPRTAAILERIPAEQRAGVIMFSWLHPGTHIISHCGFTNGRLRIHLGLKTPAGARIRVHGEERTWDAGRCLVFDDSIEHEVWHNGGEPRIVLICDVPHPGLAANDRNRLLADNALDGHERARRFMKDRGLRRVEHSRSGELQVELDRFTELNMRRFLSECGLHRMELTADGRLRTGTDGETHAAP